MRCVRRGYLVELGTNHLHQLRGRLLRRVRRIIVRNMPERYVLGVIERDKLRELPGGLVCA